MPEPLTPLAALAWEEQHPFWRRAGAKASAIRAEFGCTDVVFAAALNQALDDPVCVAAHPVTAARLRRVREAGAKLRHAS